MSETSNQGAGGTSPPAGASGGRTSAPKSLKDVARVPAAALGMSSGVSAAMEALKPSASVSALAEMLRPSSLAFNEGLNSLTSMGLADQLARPIDVLRGTNSFESVLGNLRATLPAESYADVARTIGLLPSVSVADTLAAKYPTLAALHPSTLSINDWESALTASLAGSGWPKPRRRRKPADFFSSFEVEVASANELLKALAVLQQRNSALGLVWRGQKNAEWAVDSSLTRALRDGKHKLDEDRLIAVERFQLAASETWGISRPGGEMAFFADLQHQGAPTRLIDVSLDPEIAVWFAAALTGDNSDTADGRLIAWGRSPAPRRNKPVEPQAFLVPPGTDAFWHSWADAGTRRDNGWGTGRTVPAWQPPALNRRMRAQRAAFLFDAEPLIDKKVMNLFEEHLGEGWHAKEIGQSTRVLGLPARHDVKVKPNAERMVPMFSIRISAEAKPEILAYLAMKGLTEDTIYPDRAGFVAYLRRVSAAEARLPRAGDGNE